MSDLRPPVATFALGRLTKIGQYLQSSVDWDACNSRVDVTPKFYKGIYHHDSTDNKANPLTVVGHIALDDGTVPLTF
ncbi:hypothetical protein [Sinobacterium caligoides]|uniref:hypothetical protein n=1 Tax=Sinobacterium caligoides TaxID=933926 RepID=UPI000F4BB593|nr:hypothetical protein [Sinobacterium caligoides]